MFGPWLEAYVWLKGLIPRHRPKFKKLGKIHFNFITLHYMYLISLTIIGSVIIYPAKNMAYIDALFFGSGAATQSGLNTIDINLLHLYQQITLMIIACIANPIFINTFVVFVRLYWFEKRFQGIVLEARRLRRTRTKDGRAWTRSKTDAREEDDLNIEEKGVGDRTIVIMHPDDKAIHDIGEQPHSTGRHMPSSGESASDSGSDTSDEHDSSRNVARAGDTGYHPEEESLETPGTGTGTPGTRDFASATPEREMPMMSSDPNGPAGKHVASRPSSCSSQSANAPLPLDDPNGPSMDASEGAFEQQTAHPLRREITFAQDTKPAPTEHAPRSPTQDHAVGGESNDERLPSQQDAEHHIAFLERQRNPDDKAALYIPGPRDFDRGYKPERIEEDEIRSPLKRRKTLEGFPSLGRWNSRSKKSADVNSEDAEQNVDTPMTPTAKLKGRVFSGLQNTLHYRGRTKTDDSLEGDFERRGRSRTFASFMSKSHDDRDPMPYLSYAPTVGRNSAFVNLSEAQREELGGIEYRSLKTLAIVLCSYYVGFHLLAMVCLLPWIRESEGYKEVLYGYGISPTWWGFFTPASLFNDLGFTLTPDSMIDFKSAIFPLLFGSFLIIIGNTGFPCMLRFTIWFLDKVVSYGSALSEELRFLLDHPRRCFTLLFPSKSTWWLFWVLVLFNGIDLLFFIVLDLNDKTITTLPVGIRVLDGWFQATSTRTAGFSVVNLSDLHPAIQVSYLIMMYISVFPIAISVRNTNVYEERSLGVYGSGADNNDDDAGNTYIGSHLRRQLSFDLWYIFLGLFIISIVEGNRIQNTNQYAFTTFSVLFEIVSAYGTVGLSLGYPGVNVSFSGEFRTISKLVIIAMQIRGRHRGLPYALDRAILLPSEGLQRKEAEDANERAARRGSFAAAEANGAVDAGAARDGNAADGKRSWGGSPERRTKFKVSAAGNFGKLVSNVFTAGPPPSKKGSRLD